MSEYLSDCAKEALSLGNVALNNKYEEAFKSLHSKIETSFYHAHVTGVIKFLLAVMSFDKDKMQEAHGYLESAIKLTKRHRRKKSSRSHYQEYSDSEVHAEICYAELLIFHSILSFFSNEDWSKFLKFSGKAKKVYKTYRRCFLISKNRKFDSDNFLDKQFLAGVHMGIGGFYLIMSLMPSKIVSIFKLLGFSGSLDIALEELYKGYELDVVGRSPICSLICLAYHLLLHELRDRFTPTDTKISGEILDYLKRTGPNGTFTYLFAARYEMVLTNYEKSIELYDRVFEMSPDWTQLIYISYWHAMFCHANLGDHVTGKAMSDRLFEEDRWTKSVCGYMRVCFLCADKVHLSQAEEEELQSLMQQIPKWTQKIAGRTPPIEKYVASKAKKYLKYNRTLGPIIEVTHLWIGFTIMAPRPQVLYRYLDSINNLLAFVEKDPNHPCYWEDLTMLTMVKASILRVLKKPSEAESLLWSVLKNEKLIKYDTYLMPFLCFEMGMVYSDTGRSEKAIEFFERVKKFSNNYLLCNRLNARVNAAIKEVKRNRDELEANNTVKIMPDLSDYRATD